MKLSVFLAALTTAWFFITIDAAAVKKKQHKSLSLSRTTVNSHAMSTVDDERFSACGSRMDMFQVQSVSSSERLCSGCMACIDIEGFLRVPIVKGATLHLQVSKFFFNVLDKTYDLCALLDTVKDGPRCPIQPNHNGLRACLPLDRSLTTDVTASLKVTAYDSWQRQLFCLEGDAMIESTCPYGVGLGSIACNQ